MRMNELNGFGKTDKMKPVECPERQESHWNDLLIATFPIFLITQDLSCGQHTVLSVYLQDLHRLGHLTGRQYLLSGCSRVLFYLSFSSSGLKLRYFGYS